MRPPLAATAVLALLVTTAALLLLYCSWSQTCPFPPAPRNEPKNRNALVVTDPPPIVLFHTFYGYRRYWTGLFYFWRLYGQALKPWPIFFATDRCSDQEFTALAEPLIQDGFQVQLIRTPGSTWGQRLIEALDHLTDFSHAPLMYIQEDIWLTQTIPNSWPAQVLQAWYASLRSLHAVRSLRSLHTVRSLRSLKLFPRCQCKAFDPQDKAYHDPTWYVVSHQPSLWNLSHLRALTRADDHPFSHETRINHWYHEGGPSRIQQVDCIEPVDPLPYLDVSRRGQLRPEGRSMLREHGLSFEVDDDEVMYRGQ